MSGTFRALRFPGYRYLWLGQLGHSATMWMEQVVRPLLILELTGSALQVGLVVSVRMIPQLLFGLLAGVIADRYNKRLVLMSSQLVTMIMHLILAHPYPHRKYSGLAGFRYRLYFGRLYGF